MHRRGSSRPWTLKALLLSLFGLAVGLLGHNAAYPGEAVAIGIVVDGDGLIYQEGVGLFTEEIRLLTEGEFDVRMDDPPVLKGGWSVDGVEDALRSLHADPDVDMVLAIGYVSGSVAARMPDHPKPTFAPISLDSELSALPRSGNSSGVENLNYLSEEIRFADDLVAFRDVVRFRKVALLLEESIHDAVPGMAERGRELAADLGVELVFILQGDPADDLVARIPDDVDAVMLGPLPRMDRAGVVRLVESLTARGLPGYSLVGTALVRQGLLAASTPDSDWSRLARRNALNMQAVLLGESAGEQPVSFRRNRRLTINMETARRLGISPRFDVLGAATLLNEDTIPESRLWSLSSVAREALAANPDIRSGMAELAADAEREAVARSRLRPQVDAMLGVTRLNGDSPSVAAGQTAEQTAAAQLRVRQVLWSESSLAGTEVEQHRQRARMAEQRVRELDVVRAASTGFLHVLKAQTAVDIRRRALELARTNLDLAQARERLGAANASDVFRWESEVASARQDLLAVRAAREQAMDAMNRLLHRPIAERFETEPASLSDSSLLVSRNDLVGLVDSQRAVDAMAEIFIAEGLANAPELHRLAAETAAVARQVRSHRRSYWSPELDIVAQAGHVLEEQGRRMGSAEGESDWQVSVNLTLPLHLGGRRKSDIARGIHTLNSLELQGLAERSRIEQEIRSGLHAAQASYAAIELAARAADSARKNLALIQDNYESGTVSIIGYLDARDAFLDADQRAMDAVYNFLIDLMELQRATGSFDFFLDAASMDAMAERIRRRVADGP